MNDLISHLNSVRICEIWRSRKDLIYLKPNQSVEEASKILADNDILSAPVYDHEARNWLGFVDVFDILACVLSIYSEANDFTQKGAQWGAWCRDIDTLQHRGIRFSLKPIKHIINFSGHNPYVSVSLNGTLFQLIEELFCKGIHRVAIMDENLETPLGIITQSDIIYYLSKYCLHLLDPIRNKSIGDLKLGSRSVIQMSHDALAIHAFYLMFYNKVSAIAVVEKNKIIGNLSTSDIRGIQYNSFSSLLKPVTDFFPSNKNYVIKCSLGDTFETILLKMAFFRIHRVWVVDEKDKPIGLISTTDIMKALTSFSNP